MLTIVWNVCRPSFEVKCRLFCIYFFVRGYPNFVFVTHWFPSAAHELTFATSPQFHFTLHCHSWSSFEVRIAMMLILLSRGAKKGREKNHTFAPGKGECAFQKGKSCSLNLVQCAHGLSFWNEKVNNLSINDIVGWYGFPWNSNPCQIQTFVKGKNWTNIQCIDVPAQLSSPIVRWLYSKSTPNQGHRHKPSASVTGVPRNLLRPIFGLLVRPAAQHKGLEAAQGRRASRKINNFPPICQPPKKTLSPKQVF